MQDVAPSTSAERVDCCERPRKGKLDQDKLVVEGQAEVEDKVVCSNMRGILINRPRTYRPAKLVECRAAPSSEATAS